jgi:hypothetical protein
MQNSFFRKSMVIGILLLFVGMSSIPSMSGGNEKSSSILTKEDIENSMLRQTSSGSPPNMLWNKTFGGEDEDEGWSVQQTADGGYILTGFYNYDPDDHNGDLWLVKTDGNGNEIWNRTFGGMYNDYGFSVKQTTDGGYIITGSTQNSLGYYDLFLIKTDMNGIAEWTKIYGAAETDEKGYDVLQETDGGYVIVAEHEYGFWLMKTNQSGDIEWEKTILIGGESSAYQIQKTADGGYVIVGCSETSSTFIVKTDSYGNIQWNRSYSEDEYYMGKSIDQTNDGGYIVTGNTMELGTYDIMLFKTDADGTQMWKQVFSGNDFYMSDYVEQTIDGGYIITGTGELQDVLILKTDANGSQQWVEYFGGTNSDWGHEVHQTTDGGYIIIGETYSSSTNFDFYLIKLSREDGENQPPSQPIITGPGYGKIGTAYTFSLGAITDPEGDQLYCYWNWSNGNTSDWLGPYKSGATVSILHAWSEPGAYSIKVKLKDSYGAESNWSAPLLIEIVQLKTAFFFGTYENLYQTEDLMILKAHSFIVLPSELIFYKGATIVTAKEYLGYLGKSCILGLGGVAIP